MIYGDPTIHIEDDQTDLIGIRTLLLSKLWQPSRWPLSIPELDAEAPDLPDVPGGVLFIGSQRMRARGALKTIWTFQGISGNGKDVTFKGRSNSLDYGFKPGFAQVAIIKHQNWQKLKDKFGGQVLDGQVIWPEFVSPAASSGAVKNANTGDLNPMFGHVDFFRMEGTYTFRYAAFAVPSMAGVGFVTGDVPGAPPTLTDGRNWLKAPTQYERRGPVFDITEVFWLSGAGGWPLQIYSRDGANITGPTNALSSSAGILPGFTT